MSGWVSADPLPDSLNTLTPDPADLQRVLLEQGRFVSEAFELVELNQEGFTPQKTAIVPGEDGSRQLIVFGLFSEAGSEALPALLLIEISAEGQAEIGKPVLVPFGRGRLPGLSESLFPAFATADLDGDSDLDLLVANFDEGFALPLQLDGRAFRTFGDPVEFVAVPTTSAPVELEFPELLFVDSPNVVVEKASEEVEPDPVVLSSSGGGSGGVGLFVADELGLQIEGFQEVPITPVESVGGVSVSLPARQASVAPPVPPFDTDQLLEPVGDVGSDDRERGELPEESGDLSTTPEVPGSQSGSPDGAPEEGSAGESGGLRWVTGVLLAASATLIYVLSAKRIRLRTK